MGSAESRTAAPVPTSTLTDDLDAPGPGRPQPPLRHRVGTKLTRTADQVADRLIHRLPRWLATQGDRPPLLLLHIAVGVAIVVFGRLVIWRQNRFGTFDHDLGIWDQAVWLLARGDQFITVRGLEVFGFHASPGLFLLTPLSWLGLGPNGLNMIMLATMALGAVPVYRIAQHHLGDDRHALVPALAFLVSHSNQWMVWETFHPEPIAVTFLLLAYLAALEGRWRAYTGWLVLAMSWKEDVALVAVMLGVVLAVRGRRTVGSWLAARAGQPVRLGPPGTRRAGVITLVGASCWFLVATQILIPAFSPGGNFTENLFGDLGGSAPEIATSLVTEPDLVIAHLEASDPLSYLHRLTASFGFVPLLAPMTLLFGLPQSAINLLAIYDFFWTTQHHYVALPLFATTVSAVEGLARLRWLPLRRAALALMVTGAFYTTVSWGLSPLSHQYRVGYWPLEPDPQWQASLSEAVALPDGDDAVSAMYYLVPHLTHRERIYTFPNPWKPSNWGVAGENPHDPAAVDWLLANPSSLDEIDRAVLVAVLDQPDQRYRFDAEVEEEAAELDLRDPDVVADLVDTDQWRIVINRPGILAVTRISSPDDRAPSGG
jgi:uncharacterized membrane protein